MRKPESSAYVNTQRRDYSLYVMRTRAIPSATDGLKAGSRRVLWKARDGKKLKAAALAGLTMSIHPHDAPESSINTITGTYVNNIPLFTGYGAFGTMLKPKAYGASRYTSVIVSEFTEDVIFRDIEIIPMMENYDGSEMEPVHFLPLVPVALINPSSGTAVGYASNILPRAFDDIIVAQITHLKGGKKISALMPKFMPTGAVATRSEPSPKGTYYYFEGDYTQKDSSTLTITKLPYGLAHVDFIKKLAALEESETVVDFIDKSKRTIEIVVKFKRGYLKDKDREEVLKVLGLISREAENFNVLTFDGQAVWETDPVAYIRKFSDWRLEWYVKRYERLRDLLKLDLQRYYDIRLAIRKKVNVVANKTKARAELKEYLKEVGIVNLDYIADFPIYRFTEDEYEKNEQRIKDAEKQLQEYLDLLADESKRKKVYVEELQNVLKNYTSGKYTIQEE